MSLAVDSFSAILEARYERWPGKQADPNPEQAKVTWLEKFARGARAGFVVDKFDLAMNPSSVILWGKTSNNLKHLTFLANSLARCGSQPDFIHMTPTGRNVWCRRMPDISTSATLFSVSTHCLLYLAKLQRTKGSPTKIDIAIRFTRAFIGTLALLQSQKSMPKALITANDHLPQAIGVIFAFKAFRLPVIYVQHAPVTDLMPFVGFSKLILTDQLSSEIYESLGEARENILVLPRTFPNEDQATDKKMATHGTAVCIYLGPSLVTDFGGVELSIEALRSNPSVDHVSISIHPSDTAENFPFRLEADCVTSGIPPHQHVGLVANSGVSFELIERRIPQFKVWSLDFIRKDMHQLVQKSLIPAVDIKALASTDFSTTVERSVVLESQEELEPPEIHEICRFLAGVL